MRIFKNILTVTLKWELRDRVLYAILAVALLILILVPSFSIFSMRQVQELSITLSLSAISVVLLVLAALQGASSVWRDIERRYTLAILGLPVPRSTYVLGKFAGIASFIAICGALLSLAACAVIALASVQYPSDIPIHWLNIFIAVFADILKYILLAAVALLFSTISTSFFLPFFATLAIYVAGSGSQEVYEYLAGDFGSKLTLPVKVLIKAVYFILPNFAAFNFKVQAIYGLTMPVAGVAYSIGYFLVYTSLLLYLSVWSFSRRELM